MKSLGTAGVIATPLGSHPCAHDDCDRMIDLESFACLEHWEALAETFQMKVGEVWIDRERWEGAAAANLVLEANEQWRGE